LYLTLNGIEVIIIEKDHVGRHASSVNAGGVRRLGRALPEIPLADAALTSWKNIKDLVDDDCGFVSPGQVKVAENETALQTLVARRETLLGLGFAHEEVIGREQLHELLPAIADHCVGGMAVHGDGHANPFRTVHAFKRKAISLGVRIFENTPVTDIQRRGAIWRVGSFEAPVIVNCAGAWGDCVAAMLGDHAPVEACALMLMITDRLALFVTPVVGALGRSLSLKQFDNGTVLIGGTFEGRAEPEHNRTNLDVTGLAANAGNATTLFPVLHHTNIVRCWAGIEGKMPDAIPVIGPGTAEGAFHAFCFSAHGFALTPIIGQIIADLIATDLPIESFAVRRFSPRHPVS